VIFGNMAMKYLVTDDFVAAHGWTPDKTAKALVQPLARELLEGARAQIVDPRFSHRAPWLRPEDYALRVEALRRAIGQAPKP
jgi:hypothetical protein